MPKPSNDRDISGQTFKTFQRIWAMMAVSIRVVSLPPAAQLLPCLVLDAAPPSRHSPPPAASTPQTHPLSGPPSGKRGD